MFNQKHTRVALSDCQPCQSFFFCPIFMICLIFQVNVGCGMWPFLPIRNTCLRPLLMALLSYGLSLMLRSNEPTKRMVIPRPSHVLLSVMVKLAEINIKSKNTKNPFNSRNCDLYLTCYRSKNPSKSCLGINIHGNDLQTPMKSHFFGIIQA